MKTPKNLRYLSFAIDHCHACPFRIPVPPNWQTKCFAKYRKGHVIARNPQGGFPPSCPLGDTLPKTARKVPR